MKPPSNKIYLASKSPRRRELLRQIGVEFSLLMLRERSRAWPGSDGSRAAGRSAGGLCLARGARKGGMRAADDAAAHAADAPILAADTTVTIDGRILGKPAEPGRGDGDAASAVRAHAPGADLGLRLP